MIKGLAKSKTFQKFAVMTDHHVQKYKKEGLETVTAQMDELHKQATRAAYSSTATSRTAASSSPGGAGKGAPPRPPPKPPGGLAGFFGALGKVIRRDLGMDKQ